MDRGYGHGLYWHDAPHELLGLTNSRHLAGFAQEIFLPALTIIELAHRVHVPCPQSTGLGFTLPPMAAPGHSVVLVPLVTSGVLVYRGVRQI